MRAIAHPRKCLTDYPRSRPGADDDRADRELRWEASGAPCAYTMYTRALYYEDGRCIEPTRWAQDFAKKPIYTEAPLNMD